MSDLIRAIDVGAIGGRHDFEKAIDDFSCDELEALTDELLAYRMGKLFLVC